MSQPEVNAVQAATPAASKLHVGFLKNNLREYGMLISLVAIMVLFQVLTDGTLLRPLNLTNLLLQNSYVVIMALGMLLVIVAGHIDLSVGSVCGFIGALAAVLMVNLGWHFVPAAFVSLVAGGLIGAAQGWFVAYARIHGTCISTISTAASAPMKPHTDPTDRSMCPATITSSMPSAMMTM